MYYNVRPLEPNSISAVYDTFSQIVRKTWSSVDFYVSTFNSIFRYIDNVRSQNNSLFGDHLHRIYPNELDVNDTTDNQKYSSYLDLHLEIDNGGKLKAKSTTNSETSLFQ